MMIDTAFLVCAGIGTRMRPLTDHCPKPLVLLNNRPILDYIFDHLRTTSIRRVVINTHYLPDHFPAYLKSIPDFEVIVSHEPELLETGGGLVKALPYIGHNPFFMINGDAFWVDHPPANTLHQMMDVYNPDRMDILLCLTPTESMTLTEAVGDYRIDADCKALRSLDKTGTHMFTGIRILNPAIMNGFKEEKFSFLKNMDKAEKAGRLHTLVMRGDWHHISTPDDLYTVEKYYQDKS